MSRRRKSDLFSPGLGGSTISRINPPSPAELISPSTVRHGSALSTLTDNTQSTLLAPSTNINDEQDKKERRRSKMLELQRQHLGSPVVASADRWVLYSCLNSSLTTLILFAHCKNLCATTFSRLRSVPNSGMTNQQLTDHYSNCIKLSAENVSNRSFHMQGTNHHAMIEFSLDFISFALLSENHL